MIKENAWTLNIETNLKLKYYRELKHGGRNFVILFYLHGWRRSNTFIHYSTKLKEHVDIMIFIERYPLIKEVPGLCQTHCK